MSIEEKFLCFAGVALIFMVAALAGCEPKVEANSNKQQSFASIIDSTSETYYYGVFIKYEVDGEIVYIYRGRDCVTQIILPSQLAKANEEKQETK